MGSTHSCRELDGNTFYVPCFEKGIMLGKIRTGTAKAGDPDSRLGRAPVPEDLITRTGHEGTLAPHVEKETSFCPKMGVC